MKKVLVAALAAVSLLGAGCTGGSPSGQSGANTFTLQGHVFTMPQSGWRAINNPDDSSEVDITTGSGSVTVSMELDTSEPEGAPEFKADGSGEFYTAKYCTGPLACYGYLDTVDNGFWDIRVTVAPRGSVTLEEVQTMLKSAKRK